MGLFDKAKGSAVQKPVATGKSEKIQSMSFESPAVIFISSGYDAHGNIAALNFIALIPDTKDGIRLTSIPPKSAVEFFKKYPVINLKLGSDKEPFVGTNGVFGRYPKIGRGIKHSKNECQYVVLCKDSIGKNFIVSDASGKFGMMSEDQAISYATMFGFANGKVVEKDGKKFLSAIAGEYPVVNLNFVADPNNKNKSYQQYAKALENTVGKERADFILHSQIIRHIGNAELYKWAMEETANKEDPTNKFGYGIGLVGCMIYAKDKKDGVKDEKLVELLSKLVEPGVLPIIDKIVENGWDFVTVWDSAPTLQEGRIDTESSSKTYLKGIVNVTKTKYNIHWDVVKSDMENKYKAYKQGLADAIKDRMFN